MGIAVTRCVTRRAKCPRKTARVRRNRSERPRALNPDIRPPFCVPNTSWLAPSLDMLWLLSRRGSDLLQHMSVPLYLKEVERYLQVRERRTKRTFSCVPASAALPPYPRFSPRAYLSTVVTIGVDYSSLQVLEDRPERCRHFRLHALTRRTGDTPKATG